MKIQKENYYGMTQCLSDNRKLMCCIVQYGTGNTKETTNLKEKWFPYSQLKGILKSNVKEDLYVEEVEFIRITVIKESGKKTKYEFEYVEETKELVELFKVPDFFDGEDWSFLNGD